MEREEAIRDFIEGETASRNLQANSANSVVNSALVAFELKREAVVRQCSGGNEAAPNV
jgi:hypothetical protein